MLSNERIKLALALTMVISLIAVIGISSNLGGAASANPMKGRLFRRHNKTKDKPTGKEMAFLRKQAGLQDGPKEERTLKARSFKDMPLEVRKVKNLDSDTWHKDLEIEVKNIGTKPIYSILAYLEFPDDKVPGDGVSGILLQFGVDKYIDLTTIGDPQDPRLNPGDTYVFTIAEQYRKGLKIQHERSPEAFKRLDLHFGVISFGDGTGFEAERTRDYRKIKQSNNGENRKHHPNRPSESKVRSPPQDGCGSCSRYIVNPETVVICYDTPHDRLCNSHLVTYRSWAPCVLSRAIYFDCDDDGIKECHHDETYSSDLCPGYAPEPSPSPSPTPSPTCDPATKPNNTNCTCATTGAEIGAPPQWACTCFDSGFTGQGADYHQYPGTQGYAGCPSNKYNNGSDCCVCIVQECPDGRSPNRMTCECPTPTPGSGGPGGGNPNQNPPVTYKDECVDYYYVHFASYDGGITWNYADDERYAGCFYAN